MIRMEILVTPREGETGFDVAVPALFGLTASGETRDEAIANTKQAIADRLAPALELQRAKEMRPLTEEELGLLEPRERYAYEQALATQVDEDDRPIPLLPATEALVIEL